MPRSLPLADLREWIPKLVAMSPDELADLPGVSPSRTHQIVPGASWPRRAWTSSTSTSSKICPWALREGVILERIDRFSVQMTHQS